MARRALLVIVIALAAARVARADEARDRQGYLSIPLDLGATTRDGGHFAWGVRPELLIAPNGYRSYAIGAFADVERSSADTALAIGTTATYYLASNVNVAPSVGVYHRWLDVGGETGVLASAFVGHRDPSDEGGLDVPIGVRVDYRSDFGDHHEVAVYAVVDLMPAIAIVALMATGPHR